jgi:tRNA (cytidine/uridine-2'-O-)-methyltransferase
MPDAAEARGRVPDMKIVLVAPEIPGNTGTIGRTCVALDMERILIRPFGFELTDKTVRRAGLDYWKHVRLSEYADWDAFLRDRAPARGDLFLFEDDGGAGTIYDASYTEGAFLVFGRETTGLPSALTTELADRVYRLPMLSPHVRSLNLANAATAVAYQAMQAWLRS